jgi:hypothetical protein
VSGLVAPDNRPLAISALDDDRGEMA